MHYDERTVNAIVGRFSLDHASLRRYLVDGGFLDRDHGTYRRSGGRIDRSVPRKRRRSDRC